MQVRLLAFLLGVWPDRLGQVRREDVLGEHSSGSKLGREDESFELAHDACRWRRGLSCMWHLVETVGRRSAKLLRVTILETAFLSLAFHGLVAVFISQQVSRQDSRVLGEGGAHLHLPNDCGDEHDDHDDQGSEGDKTASAAGTSNGEKADQTDLTDVETGDELLQSSSIALALGVDLCTERKEHVVAEAEVHESEADSGETKDQWSDDSV